MKNTKHPGDPTVSAQLHIYSGSVWVKSPACVFLMKTTDDKNDPPHEEAR